jgi:hypothetical protein
MIKAKVRFALLALLLPLLLNATHILKDDLLKPKAATLIEQMGNELLQKTGINEYLVATNENFPERFNLVAYSKRYEANMSKPYVLLIFAPNALITKVSGEKGRVGVIPSSKALAGMYRKSDVLDATIDVVAAKDKNSNEDKFNVGIVQGFSELADQVAEAKNVKLTTTLPNDTRTLIGYIKILVYIGALLVLWIFLIRPIMVRIKDGKKE